MKWLAPKYIAHRCGGVMAPENTLHALQAGIQFGFSAVEFDVMLSMDGIPFLMHDELLERTVRNSPFTGMEFNKMMSADLDTIDVGSWFLTSQYEQHYYEPKSTSYIPRFEEILRFCSEQNIFMNIEIKPCKGYERITGQLVGEMTVKYFPQDDNRNGNVVMPLFSSFSFDALKSAMEVTPHIPRGYLIDNINESPIWLEQLQELDAVSLHTNHQNLSQTQCEQIKAEGYKILCYTVNSVERSEELFVWGVDSICTDRLDLFNCKVLN